MEPYFQLCKRYGRKTGMDKASEMMDGVLIELTEMGLEAKVRKCPDDGSCLVWNVSTPNVTLKNERTWTKKIKRVCDEQKCECRFRFPSFLRSNING